MDTANSFFGTEQFWFHKPETTDFRRQFQNGNYASKDTFLNVELETILVEINVF
jgi:hypothetical protein